jgi:hypothetical protein
MIRKKVPLLLVGWLLCAAPALADPINITGGSIVYERQNVAVFRATGVGGWSIDGLFGESSESWDPDHFCAPCTPLTELNVSQSESITDSYGSDIFAGGSFRMGGTEYWVNSLAFSINALSTVTVPVAPGRFTYGEPAWFVFRGVVTGTSDLGASAQANLFGVGRAWVGFLDNSWWTTEYRFADPAAVPEPGTLLLFATGAAAVIRRRLTS